MIFIDKNRTPILWSMLLFVGSGILVACWFFLQELAKLLTLIRETAPLFLVLFLFLGGLVISGIFWYRLFTMKSDVGSWLHHMFGYWSFLILGMLLIESARQDFPRQLLDKLMLFTLPLLALAWWGFHSYLQYAQRHHTLELTD